MKVTDVKIHIVSVPVIEPETWRFGRLWGLTSAVVEVETDEGVTGLGESLGSPYIKLVVEAIRQNAEWLKGKDPLAIRSFILDSEDRGWHHYPHIGHMASAALEMALWDIAGKVAGQPLHRMFGGAVRERVPYYWYMTVLDRTPEGVRRQAREGVDCGFRTVYMKVGFDIDDDIRLIREIRDEVGPKVGIRVDPNEGWSVYDAVRALRELEEVNLEYVEEPIDMNNLEALAYLRKNTRTRIGSNQSSWFAHNVRDVLVRQAADVIATDPHQLGSLLAFRDVAAMCGIFGVPLNKHAFGDLGITTAAALHVLATIHGPELPHQQYIQVMEHDLLAEPLLFDQGCLEVPNKPGIGVELDRDAIAHYGRLYEEYGEFEGYSPGFGPSIVPEHERRPGRRIVKQS
jgi:L-alanine-DL-glutamate epimerase-like enolase superfamily enzyme